MTAIKFLLFFSLLLLHCHCELIMVMETFRHGAREALYDWWNAKDFPHWGELTPVGMRQHYNLGQTLRKIYIDELHFLSEAFNPDEIWVRSTDVNRTLVSALSQLYGLYPMGSGPKLPEGLDPSLEQPPFAGYQNDSAGFFGVPFGFQPIPIHTIPTKDEFLLRSFDKICNVSNDIQRIVEASEIYRSVNQEFKSSLDELGRLLNLSDEKIAQLNIDDASNIFDVFLDDIWSKRPIPANISQELWTNLTIIYNFVIYYSLGGIRDINKFYSTPFLREIIASFDTKLENVVAPLKWKIYSAHDWTVATFTTALNITDYACTRELITIGSTNALNCALYPDFATNMLIELHKDEQGGNFIKIRYNGNYVNLCGNPKKECQYSEFRQRLSDYLVDFETICARSTFHEILDLGSSQGFLEKKII